MRPVDNLPLSEVSFYILLSLAIVPKHGYAIMKEVEGLSEGQVVLATGTLYSALRRMLGEGWIERTGAPRPEENGRGTKRYKLTEQGRTILDMESQRLEHLVDLTSLRKRQV